MSITSGFYNSLDGDRRYSAEQMSAIFNGIIRDGVFASVGTAFAVSAELGRDVKVGVGRAWFNSTWIYNDSPLSLTIDASDALLGRYDAVVLEVDRSVSVRNATIKVVKGEVASQPTPPNMINTTDVHQYPLAYIYCAANSASISQADITNTIGTSSCPFVTGILDVVNIDALVAQWDGEFNDWFESIKGMLSEDAATALALRISALENNAASYAPKEHSHAASKVTEGTLGGKVLANAGSAADVSAKQVRNIYAGTTDMTSGTTPLASGDMYFVYE